MEFTRTIKWLIWVMHVPSNLWRHTTQIWAPQLSAGQIETLCLQSKDENELIVQQEIHPNGISNRLQQWLCEALKIPHWYTSPETMIALMTNGWNQEDKLRVMVSDSTPLSELYDCSLLSMWSKAASVLVGMWSQLPTDTVTQDSSHRCSID